MAIKIIGKYNSSQGKFSKDKKWCVLVKDYYVTHVSKIGDVTSMKLRLV
jgi:hypothetical protein